MSEHDYEGTRIQRVAQQAGVTSRTVRRPPGRRFELFAIVMSRRSPPLLRAAGTYWNWRR